MSRESHARANIRGGMGVRKRNSEASMKDTYRLNGVPTGSAVARCYDKYGRWEYGYTIGVIVRKTVSVVQIKWIEDPDNIVSYDSGDARYEVDRNRWRILGILQGNPLDPNNPLADALTGLMGDGKMLASANDDRSTDRGDEEMATRPSNAATEREAAKQSLKNGDLKERETYTAKQVATRCGTDAKTMRKFFRSRNSTVEAVGQGGRYEFDARDLPKIKREFEAWTAKSQAKADKPAPMTSKPGEAPGSTGHKPSPKSNAVPDPWEPTITEGDAEPTPEELAALEELDLDDLDGDDI